MKVLTINYLSHSRPEYFSLTKKILKNISDENKSKIKLNILASRPNDWNNEIKDLGIDTYVLIIPEDYQNNYLEKVNFAVQSDTTYSCKLDEDCFISEHTWDYIIENLEVLHDTSNLVLTPIMSNNIPISDLFLEDYLNNETKQKVYDLFLKQKMPNGLWGVDYSPLDEFTIYSEKWNPDSFYDAVRNLQTETKGIHPLRINYDAQVLINEFILSNPNRLFNKQEYFYDFINRPYFTNSFFFIKTSFWKSIISETNGDNYDEIMLNKFMRFWSQDIAYVKNGFGCHIMFNTVYGNKNRWGIGGEDGWTYEKTFFNNLNQTYDTLHRR